MGAIKCWYCIRYCWPNHGSCAHRNSESATEYHQLDLSPQIGGQFRCT